MPTLRGPHLSTPLTLLGSDRDALLRGEDPDSVLDRELPATVAWEQATRKYRLYR